MPSLSPARLAELEAEVLAATQPASELERFFASEVAYATWELERVRANTSATQAESRLNSYYGRASRNWNRARKELTAIQTARANHLMRLSPTRRRTASAAPLADPARVPAPKPAGVMLDHLLDLVQTGQLPSAAIRVAARQECR